MISASRPPDTAICAVLVAADADDLYILTARRQRAAIPVLPVTGFDPARGISLERCLRDWAAIHTTAKVTAIHMTGARVLAGQVQICLVGLVENRLAFTPRGGRWYPASALFPWEDWRNGEPEGLRATLRPALAQWSAAPTKKGEGPRHPRVDSLFTSKGKNWRSDAAQARYELLYDAGLVPEALRDRSGAAIMVKQSHARAFGQIMHASDRHIVAQSLDWIRQGTQRGDVLPHLLTSPFSLGSLQNTAQAVMGVALHTQNFRRDIVRGNFIQDTGKTGRAHGARPARLWRWVENSAHTGNVDFPLPRQKLNAG